MRPRALITGGARRVGRAIALELARAGCDIVLTHLSSDPAPTANRLRELGATADLVKLDLNSPEMTNTIGRQLADDLRPIDILIHNASIYSPTPIGTLDNDAAQRFMQINAISPMILSTLLADKLKASTLPAGGAIVAMCDIHAMGQPRLGHLPYSMSKAALAEMVRSLARELAPKVRVTGVAPGVVAWPSQGPESDSEMQRQYLSRVPLERAGTPEDAAAAVRWLALEATYVTGQILRLDGGRSLR